MERSIVSISSFPFSFYFFFFFFFYDSPRREDDGREILTPSSPTTSSSDSSPRITPVYYAYRRAYHSVRLWLDRDADHSIFFSSSIALHVLTSFETPLRKELSENFGFPSSCGDLRNSLDARDKYANDRGTQLDTHIRSG